MRAFYHPDQALHAPRQYMRFGRVAEAKDVPERTARLLAALRRRNIAVETPDTADEAAIGAVHTADYLDFLRTAWAAWQALPDARGPEVWPATFPYWSGRPDQPARPPARATGFLGRLGWYLGDMSVPMDAQSWCSIRQSALTAVAAADAVTARAPVYALCRPSGHHARADRASGFCYLNNSAIAAARLAGRFGRVAVLDVDAHHGDGTQQIFYGRGDVLTVSVHADPADYYPFYTGYADETGIGAGEGANLNLPLAHGAGIAEMAAALDRASAAIRAFGVRALVVALGFDAHRDDPIGVLRLDSGDFARIGGAVAALGLPTLVVQEGGYAVGVLADSLGAFLDGLG